MEENRERIPPPEWDNEEKNNEEHQGTDGSTIPDFEFTPPPPPPPGEETKDVEPSQGD